MAISVAGATFHIGSKMEPGSSLDADDFTSVTWTRVRGTKTLGSRAETANEITTSYIDPPSGEGSRVERAKGARDSGILEINHSAFNLRHIRQP